MQACHQETMTDSIFLLQVDPLGNRKRQRRYFYMCCSLSIKDIIKFASQLILPLSLGIFTVVVTLYQQQVATSQRLEDRQLARDQREQDLNISTLQRENDRLIAQSQRENDKRIADEKRMDDRESESRQYQLERDTYLDNLLHTHMNELAQSTISGTQAVQPAYAFRSRLIVTTRNVMRQLDPSRLTELILFLYEAQYLQMHSWILGTRTQLNRVDLSESTLMRIRLSEARLNYANFASAVLKEAVFQRAHGMEVNFSNADCEQTIFAEVKFVRSSFQNASLIEANFIRADLTNSEFSYSKMLRATLVSARLINVSFVGAHMVAVNLTEADLRGAIISDSQLEDAIAINNALLPNGTLARDLNMIQNGEADCKTAIDQHWYVDGTGAIAVIEDSGSQTNRTSCIFSSRTQATMWQLINIKKPKYRALQNRKQLYFALRVARGNGTSVHIIGTDESIGVPDREYARVKASIHPQTVEAQIFSAEHTHLKIVLDFYSTNETLAWCDDLRGWVNTK